MLLQVAYLQHKDILWLKIKVCKMYVKQIIKHILVDLLISKYRLEYEIINKRDNKDHDNDQYHNDKRQ